jgi:hypothetical protein
MLAPVSMTSGPHLIGRDDELRSLLGRLDGVSSGGRVIWLVGEPGIGKSALPAGVAEQARSLGLTVLTARAASRNGTCRSPASTRCCGPCCRASTDYRRGIAAPAFPR